MVYAAGNTTVLDNPGTGLARLAKSCSANFPGLDMAVAAPYNVA